MINKIIFARPDRRQFVEHPEHYRIPQATRDLVDRLLLEKLSLAGIVRVLQVSKRWLQYYVNDKYAEVPREVEVTPKKKARLTLECDEPWSFSGHGGDQQWVWLALDREMREIVGCHVGRRDASGVKAFWASWPPVYRQCVVCYTDFWDE